MITLNYTLFGTVFINVCEYVGIFLRYYNYDNGLYEKQSWQKQLKNKSCHMNLTKKKFVSFESQFPLKLSKNFYYFKNSRI